MSKLCILQNKAIKLICDGKKSDHIISYHSKLNISKPQDLYKHEVSKIVFRFTRDNLPPTLQHLFFKTSKISIRNTRSSTNIYNLYVFQYTTTRFLKRIKYQGLKIWNQISPKLKKQIKQKFQPLLHKFLDQLALDLYFNHPSIKINIYTLPLTYVQITEKCFVNIRNIFYYPNL